MKNKMAKTRMTVGGGRFEGNLNRFQLQKKDKKSCSFLQNKMKAFSVAEAMIALLIGSLVLGFSAPMISRQIKYNNMSDVQMQVLNKKIEQLRANQTSIPSGAVIAFNRPSCPDKWTPLTTIISDTEGAFIRNIGGNADAKGTVQLDAAPNITGSHGGHGGYHGWGSANGSFVKTGKINGRGAADKNSSGYEQIDFDACNSSDSYCREATEVRPKNIALLYCVKD